MEKLIPVINAATGDTQDTGLWIALAAISVGIIICIALIAKFKKR